MSGAGAFIAAWRLALAAMSRSPCVGVAVEGREGVPRGEARAWISADCGFSILLRGGSAEYPAGGVLTLAVMPGV